MIQDIKKIFSQGSLLVISNIFQRLIQLLVLPLYARILSPIEFGKIEMLTIFSSLFSLIALLGVRQGFTRIFLLEDKENETSNDYKKRVLCTSLWFVSFWGLFCSLISLYYANYLSLLLIKSDQDSYLIFLTILWGLGLTYFQIIQAHLMNVEKVKLYAVISFSQVILNYGIILYLVVWDRIGFVGIVYANLITNSIFGTGIGLVLLIRHRFFIDRIIIRKILRFGVPAMLSSIIITLFDMIDRLFINQYLGLDDLGLYAVGRKISAGVSVTLLSAFTGVWVPNSYKIANNKNHRIIIGEMVLIFATLFSFAALVISLFAYDIIPIITTYEFLESYRIVIWLTMSHTVYVMGFIFWMGVNIVGKSEYGIIVNIITLVSGIILNIQLIPIYGIDGAAMGTFFTFLVQSTLNYFISQRLYFIEYPIIKLTSIIVIPFCIFFISDEIRFATQNIYFTLLLNTLFIGLYIFICYYISFNKAIREKILKYIFMKF